MNAVKALLALFIITEVHANVQRELKATQELVVLADNASIMKIVLIMRHAIVSIEFVDQFVTETLAVLEHIVKVLITSPNVLAIAISSETPMLSVLSKNHLHQDLNAQLMLLALQDKLVLMRDVSIYVPFKKCAQTNKHAQFWIHYHSELLYANAHRIPSLMTGEIAMISNEMSRLVNVILNAQMTVYVGLVIAYKLVE